MKITALGTGGMYNLRNFHTNFVVSSMLGGNGSDRYLLIDCGSDIRMSLGALGLSIGNINAVYITHEHADHAGGLPFLAYHSISRYPHQSKIKLYANTTVLQRIWQMLEPQCYLYGGIRRTLSSYFDIVTMDTHQATLWGDVTMMVMPWDHVECVSQETIPRHLYDGMKSYGVTLFDKANNIRVHITGDMAPTQLLGLTSYVRSGGADLVLADCYTGSEYPGLPVHPPYNAYVNLPAEVKDKLRFVHYTDDVLAGASPDGHPDISPDWQDKAARDGLRFMKVHDTYDTFEMRSVLNQAAAKEKSNERARRTDDRGPGSCGRNNATCGDTREAGS